MTLEQLDDLAILANIANDEAERDLWRSAREEIALLNLALQQAATDTASAVAKLAATEVQKDALAAACQKSLDWCSWCRGKGTLGVTACQECKGARAALAMTPESATSIIAERDRLREDLDLIKGYWCMGSDEWDSKMAARGLESDSREQSVIALVEQMVMRDKAALAQPEPDAAKGGEE